MAKSKPQKSKEEKAKVVESTPEDYLIWPKPIPVIGVTGEYSSGKTLFGLTIDPKRTLVFDEEKSSQTYDDLGIKKRIDLIDEVARQIGKTYKPIEVFEYFYDYVKNINPGEYSVIVVDTVASIESGLAAWVEENPDEFGRTRNQYQKMQNLFWGDVKEKWKTVLSDIASRCQSLVFTVHMGEEFKGGSPTGKRKPKGKSTLPELSTLFMQLERKVNPSTKEKPRAPSAIVIKDRLGKSVFKDDGEIDIIPLLPPRIPKCTPTTIRKYILNPPDYEKLSEDEKAREERLSDDERLMLENERAKANQLKAEAELEKEKIKSRRINSGGSTTTPGRSATNSSQATSISNRETGSGLATKEQIKRIAELKLMMMTSKGLGKHDEEEQDKVWKDCLKPFGVETAKALTTKKADELIQQLEKEQDPFPTTGEEQEE